jgi:hypothetical protein
MLLFLCMLLCSKSFHASMHSHTPSLVCHPLQLALLLELIPALVMELPPLQLARRSFGDPPAYPSERLPCRSPAELGAPRIGVSCRGQGWCGRR